MKPHRSQDFAAPVARPTANLLPEYRVEVGPEIPPPLDPPDGHVKYPWTCVVAGHELHGKSNQPLLAACKAIKRALMGTAEGPVQGTAAMYRPYKRPQWEMRCAVEWGCFYRVKETKNEGPIFVRFKPYPDHLKGRP